MNEQVAKKATPPGTCKEATWDLFLSYAVENADWVRAFESKVTSLGLKVFDPYSTPTEYWGKSLDEVVAAIYPSKCPIAFVVLSAAYSKSDHSRELTSFLNASKTHASSLLLPVRLDDSPIPESIQSVVILNASSQTPAQVAEGVAAKLKEWLLVPHPSLPPRTDSRVLPTDIAEKNAGDDPEIERKFIIKIRDAMEFLPPDDRRIIHLRYMEDLTYEQMAEKMGFTPSNLRLRLSKAITKLRDMLQIQS